MEKYNTFSSGNQHPSLGEGLGGPFDELVERRGSGCVKWDEAPSSDVIPLWVADMDFRAAPAIREAIRRRAEHGVFGYTFVGDDYYEAVMSWFERRHKWTIRREEILYTTGVVPAMSVAIKALTMPGEKVLILSPDYNCFFSSIRNNGCEVLESALLRKDILTTPQTTERPVSQTTPKMTFSIDWEDFEAKCADEKTTLFLLCNPHNPTGRVWTAEELSRMNDICLRHGVKVVSDEIHCELIMPGHRFQPFAAVSNECRMNGVVLNSPSKSFNIAGLQTANIVCSQPEWRRRLDRAININEVCELNPFGPVALVAAYNESEEWIDSLCQYLWGNYNALSEFFATAFPQCTVNEMEGTYLPWIDISSLLDNQGPDPTKTFTDRLLAKANVWINPGTMYGHETGKGYMRVNIACPRQRLMEALGRISHLKNT